MPGSAPYTAASFHPDGLLLVTGTSDAKAQIWEMRQQKAVTGFEAGGSLRQAGCALCGSAAFALLLGGRPRPWRCCAASVKVGP